MSRRLSEELRHLVADRADRICEYCLIHEDDTFFGCEVDHVISLKHSGPTEAENLAYACTFCNRYKGSDVASLSPNAGALVRDSSTLEQIDGLSIFGWMDIGLSQLRVLVRPLLGF